MARAEHEEIQLYFSRIRPIYHQLFNLAHAITGNRERAAYCLQYAMQDCWTAGDASIGIHGLRESLRSSVVHAALKDEPVDERDLDWDGLRAETENNDPLLRTIAQEGNDLRRMLAMKYGCGLSNRRIARVLDMDTSRVQTLLRRFEVRTKRRLSTADRRRYEICIMRAVRGHLTLATPYAPEMAITFRTFQADAATANRPSRLPARILRIILAAVLALFCMGAFWLAAVLMQPAVLENPEEITIVETQAE